ncbi:MAG: hypothetical protein BAA01_06375 [Bacillus thermozeamaize]|uniref:Probable membrane transporter protein n=1 Tax=Bacillus thermozeamaize TaxID=230954 RepID=A0A1Y3PEG9_9BACI|nr:MAG: hypothetical protein BAA01_06375 [Bacillus thermozeamaize]
MTVWLALLLLLLGVVASTIGSIVGLGGGVIIVPGLLFLSGLLPSLAGVTAQVAVGTSLLVVVFTALSSTLSYMKQKRVDVKSGLLFFIASGPASMFGAWLNQHVTSERFQAFFGLFLILMAFLLSIRDRIRPRRVKWHVERLYVEAGTGREYRYGYNHWIALAVSFVAGMMAGFFGIGGGALMVPMMVIFFAFPPQLATATSMFTILLTSSFGSLTHVFLGNINWLVALLLIPGAWAGGKLGSWISSRMSGKALIWFTRLAIAGVGLNLLIEGLW